jgi:LysM repeat protein
MCGKAWMTAVALAGVVWLGGGCDRWGGTPGNEQREANYIEGVNYRLAGQTNKAVGSFERALQVNPASTAANLALGEIYHDQRDYIRAAYHFTEYLRLLGERPGTPKDTLVAGQLENCELQLAVKYSQRLARQQVDNRVDELTRQLAEEKDTVQKLRQELARWRPLTNAPSLQPSVVAATSAPTNGPRSQNAPAGSTTAVVAANPAVGSAKPASNPATATPATGPVTKGRTYTVRSGDTPASIARKLNLTTKALLAANPGLDAKRLKVGAVLNLPPP